MEQGELFTEPIETEFGELIEKLINIEVNEFEENREIPDEADHLEAYIIDEGWIDEDGLVTLDWIEHEPPQVEQEVDISNELPELENYINVEPLLDEINYAELFPPEIDMMEPDPAEEFIEPIEVDI